jgi:hypothetical protein
MPQVGPLVSALLLAAATAVEGPQTSPRPFVITVVDEQTGRGVPLVELRTVNEVRYVTDSAGVAAVVEPGLFELDVFFHVKSHGYEFPRDGFGYRGKALKVTEGGEATIKVKRLKVAERLYRVTGAGAYRDTVLAGRKAPVRNPLLNAQVLGSDSVINAVYRGKLHWFWGDTNRPGYPLGNFHVPGAISDLPGQGGLDPEVGVDLTYYTAANGFAAETAHLPGPGPTWLGGLVAFQDADGRERLVAGYSKIRPPLDTYEHGLAEFDPEAHKFEKVVAFPLDSAIRPGGHTYLARDGGTEYVYFTTPFPLTRVRADMDYLKDVTKYEAFTCLETGSRLGKDKGKDKTPPKVDRGPDGRARYAWRADTPALGPAEQARLVRDGVLKADEALLALQDAETGKPVLAHAGTVNWNDYRKRWVMVCVEQFGSSMLGELWYAEADTPLGPWAYARKVVTHDRYSFYNPRQHPYFDKDGGRVIFFEGTYTATFSGNVDPTPRYDYNQIMYKLDLSDPRLNLPVPVYETADGGFATGSAHAGRGTSAFFALERPGAGTVPVAFMARKGGGRVLHAGEPDGRKDGPQVAPAFHALPADAKDPPKVAVPLYEFSPPDDGPPTYGTDPDRAPVRHTRSGRPVCLVWRAPTTVRLPAAGR